MPRIKVTIPETAKFIFKVQLPIYIQHINYGNHLGADSLISLIHEARVQFLRQHGMTEKDLGENIGLMITSLASTHYGQGFLGDQLIIEIYSDDPRRASCDFFYKVSNQKEQLIAIATTHLVFVDRSSEKISMIPEKLKKLL